MNLIIYSLTCLRSVIVMPSVYAEIQIIITAVAQTVRKRHKVWLMVISKTAGIIAEHTVTINIGSITFLKYPPTGNPI